MKVRYCKKYTDEFGDEFCPGWVAEHTDAEGARRIAHGVCVQVADDARSLKLAESAELVLECSEPEGSEPAPVAAEKPTLPVVKVK